jgi:hypothetical protein
MSSRPLEILTVLRVAIEDHWNLWCVQAQIVKGALDASPSSAHSATVLKHALTEIENGFEHNELFARRLFFDLPASGREGSNAFLAQSVIRIVFEAKLDLDHYDIESDFCEFIPKVRAGE